MDATIVVNADKKTRLDRIIARDHLTEQQASNRIAAQMPLESKTEMADFVIDNTGDRSDLKAAVLTFISENDLHP